MKEKYENICVIFASKRTGEKYIINDESTRNKIATKVATVAMKHRVESVETNDDDAYMTY